MHVICRSLWKHWKPGLLIFPNDHSSSVKEVLGLATSKCLQLAGFPWACGAPSRFSSESSRYGCASRSASREPAKLLQPRHPWAIPHLAHTLGLSGCRAEPTIPFDFTCSPNALQMRRLRILAACSARCYAQKSAAGIQISFLSELASFCKLNALAAAGFSLSQALLFCMEASQSEQETTWPSILIVLALAWMEKYWGFCSSSN